MKEKYNVYNTFISVNVFKYNTFIFACYISAFLRWKCVRKAYNRMFNVKFPLWQLTPQPRCVKWAELFNVLELNIIVNNNIYTEVVM